LLALLMIEFCGLGALAQKKTPDEAKAQPPHAAETGTPAPVPQETSSITQHSIVLDGQTIHYTATAGNLLVRDGENHPNGSMFYVAYTQDGAAANNRPVTFLYNGGPGSSSMWLHMGAFGPMRVETANAAATPPAPYHLVANTYSLLDKSDLVFVDAMGTGFSRAVGQGKLSDFLGVDQDVRAFNQFIARYLTVNHRWNSPKFLIGESYGTTRSAALAYSLQQSGIALNGVVLVSSILNFNDRAPGLDNMYIGYLPSYAATAWYHNKLASKPADLKAFLEQAREYARGPYAAALAKGDNLSAAEEDAVAQKMSEMTGLSVAYLKEANLRVTQERFRKELMRGDRRTVGRFDSRFEGMDLDAAGENPSYDATAAGVTGAFVAALNNYLVSDLNFTSNNTYRPTYYGHGWDWKHRAPDGDEQQNPDTALDLGAAMRENPHLQVFSANGYFDLATPFAETEYDISHMELDPSLRKNIHFGYYPSGHMIYLNVDALKQLKTDLAQFYAEATAK
jgi:carboxypeptidase C (cathepsin A)